MAFRDLCIVTGRACDSDECYQGCIRMVPDAGVLTRYFQTSGLTVDNPSLPEQGPFEIWFDNIHLIDSSPGARIPRGRHEQRNFKPHWN
ncbi:MAG TPA: hypothetical protein VJM79_10090 [Rhizorhapis sp.]|nr:hypothetical protein [Rhizorhapis sp.]